MKPIQTRYEGYYFRSRLEARWAVLFNTLQLDWRYEPNGYSLPSGPYLPDFFLQIHRALLGENLPRGSGYWVEIKREGEPTDKELRLIGELAKGTGHNAFLVAGRPWPGRFRVWKALRGYGGRAVTGPYERTVNRHLYGGLPSEWLLCERDWDMGFSVDPLDAFQRARDARFEHGEEPGLPLGWEGIEPVVGNAFDEAARHRRDKHDDEDVGQGDAA